MRVRLALLAFALTLGACSTFSVAAATVNGAKISEAQVEAELDRVRTDPTFQDLLQTQADEIRGDVRRSILTGLIRQAVIAEGAEEMDITVTDEQVDQLIEQEAARLGLTAEQFAEEQNLSRRDIEVLARRIVQRFEVRSAVAPDLEISEERLREAYALSEQQYQEVHLQRITVATEEEADAARARLSAGRSFTGLAREISIDDAAAEGGDIGYLPLADLSGLLVSEVQRADNRGITGVIAAGDGWRIYRVLDQRTQPFADVRDGIEATLVEQDQELELERWLRERLSGAAIKVNPKYGRFDPDTLSVVQGEA